MPSKHTAAVREHGVESEWKDEIMIAVADRFERRLAESLSELRREIHEGRVEMLKWTVLMWISQMALLVGILFRGR
jgi:hypothetical protein